MSFTAPLKYFAPGPSARKKPIKCRNRSQLGYSTNHSRGACVTNTVRQTIGKVSVFLILLLLRKVQFASSDTKTIVPLDTTSFPCLKKV